jgi:hypothetical protein
VVVGVGGLRAGWIITMIRWFAGVHTVPFLPIALT